MKSDLKGGEELYFIRKIRKNEVMQDFDCGDPDLNDFIKNSAADYRKHLLAVTYVLVPRENPNKVIGYCSLANDTVSVYDFESITQFNHFRRKQGFPNPKRLRTYPAIKVCRLGVDLSARNIGAGTMLLDFVKGLFTADPKAGCRFLTVDAYTNAIPFYEKNGFRMLNDKEIDESALTRPMFFDLGDIM